MVRPATTLISLCGVVAVGAAATASAVAATGPLLQRPSLAALAVVSAPIADSTLSDAGSRRLAASAQWGGTFTASSGDTVRISVSDAYPQDPAVAQRWADFLGSLVHGPELSTVNVYLAPLSEVQQYCGRDALACYSPNGARLVAPGDDPDASISAEAVVAHEYGHHVAASRSDAPWPAVAYGTKRWASYEQICAGTRAGRLFPGAEDARRYQLNPGEAFAESYRVLNQRRLGLPETTWDIVTQSLYPDETALSLIQQDVTSPWQGNTSSALSTSLSRRARTRTLSVATPFDGTLRLSAHAARGERVRLQVTVGGVTRTLTLAGTAPHSVSATVCGSRTAKVRTTLVSGAGRVTIAISRP